MLKTEKNDKMVKCNNCGTSIDTSKQRVWMQLKVRNNTTYSNAYFCCKDCLDKWLKDTANLFKLMGR